MANESEEAVENLARAADGVVQATQEMPRNLDFLLDVYLQVSVEVGRTRMTIQDLAPTATTRPPSAGLLPSPNRQENCAPVVTGRSQRAESPAPSTILRSSKTNAASVSARANSSF